MTLETSRRKALSRELAKFATVGIVSNGIYAAALGAQRAVEVAWWLSTAVAYLLSMAANYVLQRSWTFASTVSHQRSATRYLGLQVVCLLINSAGMELLVARWSLNAVVCQLGLIALNTSLSYAAQKFWIFSTCTTLPLKP